MHEFVDKELATSVEILRNHGMVSNLNVFPLNRLFPQEQLFVDWFFGTFCVCCSNFLMSQQHRALANCCSIAT